MISSTLGWIWKVNCVSLVQLLIKSGALEVDLYFWRNPVLALHDWIQVIFGYPYLVIFWEFQKRRVSDSDGLAFAFKGQIKCDTAYGIIQHFSSQWCSRRLHTSIAVTGESEFGDTFFLKSLHDCIDNRFRNCAAMPGEPFLNIELIWL